MITLGIIANIIFIYAVIQQINRVLNTKSAADLSLDSVISWNVGLAIFAFISFKTDAHWLMKINYIVSLGFYMHLLYLVLKYRREYKMPTQRKHLKVFKGGRSKK